MLSAKNEKNFVQVYRVWLVEMKELYYNIAVCR